MAGAAVASPLCTWIVAAACMSSSSSPATACSDQTRRAVRRRGAGPGRNRRFPASAIPSGGLRGSGIHSRLRSYLSFEPCPDFYRSCGVDGSLSSLFGLWKADVRRRRPPSSAASGKLITVALESAKELVGNKKKNKNPRRVVVTGMGVVTPLGHDPDIFYNNLLEGISGISEIETFDCSSYPTRIAGEIKSFSADEWVAPKLAKRMDNFMLYLLTAGRKALEDGGVTEEVMRQFEKPKCGVLIGSAMGGMKVFNDAVEALRVSYKKISPFSVPFATANMGSAMLAMDLGWMGPNYSISTACATSNFCILNAANHIIRDEADVMLCGGSDAAIIPIGLGGFVACKALSQRNNDPKKASRPWDVDRDGFVMGEGAGVLLLEELEHAKQRGAKIYAEFLGGSFTCDAYHVTEPHPEGRGIILCIENALSESGVCREDVNYVNAHATSTPFGDLNEYEALSHCFGSNPKLRVNSTKSMIGHLLGAAGAVEAVAVVQAIRTGWVHPNINLDNPEESVIASEIGKLPFCEVVMDADRLVSSRKERLDVKVALSNSFGFGGHNSSILLAPYK